MSAIRVPLDWRKCSYLSLTNAGRVAGKSAAWARGAVCTGDLQAVRLPHGGSDVITVKSLAAFLDRAHPVTAEDFRAGRLPFQMVH